MLSSPSARSQTAVLNGNVSCSAQRQSIPAVPSRGITLQCPTTKYPCSAQLQSIPAVPNRRVSSVPNRRISLVPSRRVSLPNHQVSLQCLTARVSLKCPDAEYPQFPTAEYPCSAQPQSIPAQPPSIPAVPNRRVSLRGPTAKYPQWYQPQSFPSLPGNTTFLCQ